MYNILMLIFFIVARLLSGMWERGMINLSLNSWICGFALTFTKAKVLKESQEDGLQKKSTFPHPLCNLCLYNTPFLDNILMISLCIHNRVMVDVSVQPTRWVGGRGWGGVLNCNGRHVIPEYARIRAVVRTVVSTPLYPCCPVNWEIFRRLSSSGEEKRVKILIAIETLGRTRHEF